MVWGREGADHFLDLPGFHQGAHVDPAINPPVIVGDACEVAGTLPIQGRN
jgi:hypothetical protein